MKSGDGQHFEQSYSVQAGVDSEGSMLVLGQYAASHANDKLELGPAVKCVGTDIRKRVNNRQYGSRQKK
ncbi:MAG: hypothetical protein A2017_07450 [Lentisphaerae bacterium GWF2_44_16]|nr:MAG: hypothetical protein A2017_07450 [Lentisphaerae bacterium GWF2_44_16]